MANVWFLFLAGLQTISFEPFNDNALSRNIFIQVKVDMYLMNQRENNFYFNGRDYLLKIDQSVASPDML